MNHFSLPIVRTKSGAAAMWDEGGFDGTTGRAVVVTGAYGEKLRPYFVYRGTNRRANAKHALMPLYIGGYIVQVDITPETETARILQVAKIEDEADVIKVELVAMSNGTSWEDGKLPPRIVVPAIEAAHTAANTYGRVDPAYFVDTYAEA